MDKGRLLDLTPQAPGYGMLPVGGDPETVAASQDGCWVVTANRTSCDLAMVDPARLMVDTFSTPTAAAAPTTGAGESLRRLVVRTGSGRPLHAAIGEFAFLPPPTPATGCAADARPQAVATFPGCDLVAILELSFADATATMRSAYFVHPDLAGGAQDAGSEPRCPVDCPDSRSPDVGPGGGTASVDGGTTLAVDGGLVPAARQLLPLALVPDGTRVYVASLRDSAVTALDIGEGGLGNPQRTELAENPGGVTRLRLAIDPYATLEQSAPDGTTRLIAGEFLRGRGAFLYALAADDSMRVLDLDGPRPVECDVNILPPSELACPAPGETTAKATPCFPVGTPGRRPLARGPGIHLPNTGYPNSPPPLPRDVTFAVFQPSSGNSNYHALSGQFGFVLATNGQVYVLNLAPNGEDGAGPVPAASCASHLPDGTACLPATATHSFRETREVGQCARTDLAVSIAPQRSVIQSDQAFATTATFPAGEGPLLKSFSDDAGETTKWLDFPDADGTVSQKWDVVWEGVLPGTVRSSGIIRSNDDRAAGSVQDAGANFCASSVEPGDILMFAGCTKDVECQPDDQFSCQVSVSGARGVCLPIDAAASAAVIETCGRFMGSRMRYEVDQVKATAVTLRLKLDEVPKTTLNPCQEDADCWPDAEHSAQGVGSQGKRAFACVEVRPQERRCVQPCSEVGRDAECRTGHVCEAVPWVESPAGRTFCVEAPPIDQRCFPQPMTTYSVRAGHAFTVTGSALPMLHNGRIDADGTCRYDAAASPVLVNRIPLSAPACPEGFLAPAAVGASRFVQNLSAQAGSNPCLYKGSYNDGAASTGTDDREHVRAFFQNPQIRFVLANLDQYMGDLLAIHFELQYGFVPLTVQPSYDVLLTMGARIIVGPTKTPESPIRQKSGDKSGDTSFPYLYVVDQGRTYLTPGSRGQVLRINARAGSSEVVTFDTTYSGSTPFQLQ
jgi:hypothetical protein